MFRTSSPERKKRRRVSKGRRRAIKWFRSPTRSDGRKSEGMKSHSSEASVLNNIASKLFGTSSSLSSNQARGNGKDFSNVSIHHETPVHLLPEEQLFADPSTQWVVQEYWKRLTLQTRLWLLLKRLIFLFFACLYAIITVGPASALATGKTRFLRTHTHTHIHAYTCIHTTTRYTRLVRRIWCSRATRR